MLEHDDRLRLVAELTDGCLTGQFQELPCICFQDKTITAWFDERTHSLELRLSYDGSTLAYTCMVYFDGRESLWGYENNREYFYQYFEVLDYILKDDGKHE